MKKYLTAFRSLVEQALSAAYEHSIKLPKVGWNNLLEDWWRQKAASLYNQLDIENWLSPDLLFMLEQEPESIEKIKKYFHETNSHYTKTPNPLAKGTKIKMAV